MTAPLVVALLALATFGGALWGLRVGPAAGRAAERSVDGLVAMLDPELDDRAKERAVRGAGLGLIGGSLWLLALVTAAVAVAAVPVLAADAAGLAPRDDVVTLLLDPGFVIVVSVAAIVVVAALRRRRPSTDAAPADDAYSMPDRLLHAMAFARPRVLRTVSRVEDRVLSRSAEEPSAPPIFVTSLARAGTTAVLNALHELPGVATHTYRDMPFLTAPTLWNRVAGGSRRRVERHERAHGDGLEIDLDSPEAFEEVLWRMFWPEKYRGATIEPWGIGDRRPDAEAFLSHHMGKVVHARRSQGHLAPEVPARYCSKNNANIARLPVLRAAFPDSRIVVPVRRPECHAASLLRQHHNFLARQSDDEFVRRYMRDIGHFEFGLAHRPIAFPGFDPDRYDPATPDYWLDYWVHAFREVLAHDDLLLVAQDDLRAAPQATMAALCEALDLDTAGVDVGAGFRPGRDEAPTDVLDPRLFAEATELYRELATLTVGAPARPTA